MSKKIQAITDLQPQRQNANRHTQRGLGLLEDSIQRDGWLGAITVAADGETFDGSARIEVGANAGFDEAIVVESDGSKPVIVKRVDIESADDPKAKRLGIAANRIAQVDLDWDAGILAELAQEGIELSDLFSGDELLELLGEQEPEPGDGGDDFDTTPDEEQTRVHYGDLWACGRHRVLCGDSTKAEDVARLMGGEKASLVATDPPYGVDYAGIENDARKTLEALLRAAISAACANAEKGASVYMFHADRCADIANNVFREFCQFSSMIVWVKPSLVMGQSDYHSRHEPCLYGWFSNGTHQWHGDRKGDSVWEMGREDVKDHTTPKPVAFFERVAMNSSKAGQVIFDPFLGSGTTLIAAERTNRKCSGIEISPKYVNVILNRYEAETGGTAELIERVE